MYGQSYMVRGDGGQGPVPFRQGSPCWGYRVTFHVHCSAGIGQVRWVHLARQYLALPRPWLRLRMESSVSRDLLFHVPQMWRCRGPPPWCTCRGPGCAGAGWA